MMMATWRGIVLGRLEAGGRRSGRATVPFGEAFAFGAALPRRSSRGVIEMRVE